MLEALLSGIAKRVGHPAYRGCPFLNLATELTDPNHPGRVVAAGNKEEMRKRLAACPVTTKIDRLAPLS